MLTKRYYHLLCFNISLDFLLSLHEPVIFFIERGKCCGQGDEAMQNVMALAFIGNKGALIKGFQYSEAARLHSGGRPSALQPDQLIRIQLEDVS